MAVSERGIDIKQSAGGQLVFEVGLDDSTGSMVTSGTTSLYLYELQSDGTLKSYDFNDNTFKTTALTTETVNMTHRKGNNGNTNTGIWTYSLGTLSGFTIGAIYISLIVNTGANPVNNRRKFQYGSGQEGSNHKKNQALSSFEFMMTDSTVHNPATGKTVSVTRSIDGGAFAAGTLSAVTEVSNGMYKVDFAAADLNGDVIILRATASGCDDTFERIVTVP